MARMYCDIEGCGTEIPPGTGSQGGLPICPNCRQTRYYWRKRGAAALHYRQERLKFFESRLDYLAPHIGRMIRAARERVAAARDRAEARH